MKHAFLEKTYELSDLTWQEWTTIRRLRCDMTKAMLAEACGVSRTTLWRAIEAPYSHPKWIPLTDEMRTKVEAALELAELDRATA